MKALVAVIIVGVAIVIVLVVRSRLRTRSTASASLTMEQKLHLLASCGLGLSPPFTPEDLLSSWGREDYEEPGFDMVLVGLGMTEEQPPWRKHCFNLWHFDTECIEDHGDYKRIVERMVEMAQGSLPLEDIQDSVDVENGQAWFSYTLRGSETRVPCRVEDDWVDTTIFAHFVDLLGKSDPDKVFIYYDLGGQDCMIGCVTRDQLKRLNSEGVNFVPLK